ncbi:MAG: redoxin domain-containing protein [Phycisphaera sp.]|nr:redoxin domain-containing protein [Phycisphaera sp.]
MIERRMNKSWPIRRVIHCGEGHRAGTMRQQSGAKASTALGTNPTGENMLNRVAIVCALSLLMTVASFASAQSLKVGDPAPKLQVSKWLNGEPVEKFESGKIYVIECWATWCGPCVAAIPHVSEMNTRFKDKGVVFIGMNVWEDAPGKVAKFVEKMGDKLNYRVAIDDGGRQGKTAETWLAAAGRNGIPCSFVVDKEGKLAWVGHPMAGLDKVVEGLVAGTYDPKAEAERQAKMQAAQAKMQAAMQAGDNDTLLKLIDEQVAADPKTLEQYGPFKFMILLTAKKDFDAAYKLGGELVDGPLKDNAMALNQLAWTIATEPAVEKRDFDVAMKMAERAVEITKRGNGAILDTLARVHFEKGQIDKAVTIQKEAVDAEDQPQRKAGLKATLEKYEQALKDKAV